MSPWLKVARRTSQAEQIPLSTATPLGCLLTAAQDHSMFFYLATYTSKQCVELPCLR